MQLRLLLVAFQVAYVLSYSIIGGSVSAAGNSVELGEFMTQQIKQLTIGPKDKIDISLKVDELSKKPHQAVVVIGNGEGLDYSVVPSVSVPKSEVSLSLPITKLPNALKVQSKLFLKIILADADNQGNLQRSLVEIIPSPELKAATSSIYKPAQRIGIKPEIHHIFKEDPTTVNPVFPLVFILGAFLLFLSLLAAWGGLIGSNLFNHFSDVSGCQLIYHFAFLCCLVGYEVIFVKYYLGSSIFTTIFHAFVLTGPSIYFGSRVFRELSKFRKIGKL